MFYWHGLFLLIGTSMVLVELAVTAMQDNSGRKLRVFSAVIMSLLTPYCETSTVTEYCYSRRKSFNQAPLYKVSLSLWQFGICTASRCLEGLTSQLVSDSQDDTRTGKALWILA